MYLSDFNERPWPLFDLLPLEPKAWETPSDARPTLYMDGERKQVETHQRQIEKSEEQRRETSYTPGVEAP